MTARDLATRWEYRERGDTCGWTFSCVGFPTRGLNGTKGLLRMHWRDRKRYSDGIASLLLSGKPDTISPPLVVLYARGYRARPMDEDNLAASAKPILDGLKSAGIIVDDSPDKLTLRCVQRPKKELGCDWQLVIAENASSTVAGGRARSRSASSRRSSPPGPAGAF